jgi:hypothetical protein
VQRLEGSPEPRTAYQQTDEQTVLAVMLDMTRIRDAKAVAAE